MGSRCCEGVETLDVDFIGWKEVKVWKLSLKGFWGRG